MRRNTIYLALLSWCFLPFLLEAQKIPFDNYTIHQGLPQNSVLDITQDTDGYLWFATQVGISRFDGREFRNFYASGGLPDNYVNCLLSDSRGNIWIGTESGGLARYDRREFKIFNHLTGLAGDQVEGLHEDRYGNIWVRTPDGLSRITPDDSVFTYTVSNGLAHNNVICMYEDNKGRMWFGTQQGITVIDGDSLGNPPELQDVIRAIDQDSRGNYWIATQESGLCRYDGKKLTHYTTADGLTSNIVLSLFIDSKDHVWCGVYKYPKKGYKGGINMYDGKKFTIHTENGIGDKAIMQFFEDSRGTMWARPTENGVYRLVNGTFINLNKKNGLVNNYVLKIFEDRQKNLWFGTMGGVSEYSKFTFEVYQDHDGLKDNNIFSVMVDKEGNIWAGSNSGLTRFDRKRFISWGPQDGLPDYTITALLQDSGGDIWAGSYSELSLIREGHIRNFQDTSILDQRLIYDLAADRHGGIWIATEKGIYYFRNGRYSVPFPGHEIEETGVRGIFCTGDGLWAATDNGVYHHTFSSGLWDHLTTANGLVNNKCRDITQDGRGNIWVATDGGLSRISQEKGRYVIHSFTTDDGLTSNTLYFVIPDGLGRLWIGHEKGLNRLDLTSGEMRSYGVEEGFTPLETNQGAVAVDQKHNLWIGTVAGLCHYNPQSENDSPSPPVTFLRKILVSNKDIDFTPYCDSLDPHTRLPVHLALPSNKNTLTFEYIGIHFTIPGEVKYRYFLKNYDRDWSPVTADNTVTYRRLPPGQYTFMVKAENYAGIWNEKPYAYSFRITPPFWQTTWFILLMVLLGIFLIFQLIKFRERQLIREKRILEEKVKERTQRIEKQKEELEAQRDRIVQQNREIKDSIQYAQRIQSAVLPEPHVLQGLVKEYFILFRPRDIVSGDFYWTHRDGNRAIIVAADCTGHGVPGAFMSMLGVSLLSEIVNKDKLFQANLILNRLRDYIKNMLGQTGKKDEAKDGMDMALVILDYDKRQIQYAGAYNPLILIRNHELLEYKGDKMPIGIQINEKESFTNHVLEMMPGDTLYIFSDGYADQFGGEKGGKFKIRPFKRLLTEIHKKPMSEQKEILEKILLDWMGDEAQVDDILVIGVKP